MATHDGSGSPGEKLDSSLSSLPSSSAASSLIRPQSSISKPADSGILPSRGVHGPLIPPSTADLTAIGRDIGPWEPVTCEILTETVRSFLPTSENDDATSRSDSLAGCQQQLPVYRAQSLETVLRDADMTIRYNAKWFAPAPVATLLLMSLEAASASSASADLYAALSLIDTIGTYSLLPGSCLLPVARFISHAYYQGSRSNRLKRLSEEAWSVTMHILQTHLNEQFVAALLNIISDDLEMFDSRVGFGHTAGALMIVADRLLFQKSSPGKVHLTAVLGSLRTPAVRHDNIVREQIIELLIRILSDPATAHDLDSDAGWDKVLDLLDRCVESLPSKSPQAQPLADALAPWISRFESRQLAIIARIFVHVGRPLAPSLNREYVFEWSRTLPQAEWTEAFDSCLVQLCQSSEYAVELTPIVQKSMEILLQSDDAEVLNLYIEKYKTHMYDPATSPGAAAVIGSEFVKVFRQSMETHLDEWKRILFFNALCDISDLSLDAARMLFRLRADITGAIYFKAGPVTPSAIQTTPTTTVLYDARPFSIEKWHEVVLRVVRDGAKTWETYDCYLFSLPYLISNHKMFEGKLEFIEALKSALCFCLEKKDIPEPPPESKLSKYHGVTQHIQVLTAIMSYHRHFTKQGILNLIATFNDTSGSGDYSVSKQCIHALTICCYEVPDIMTSHMDNVINKMSKMVTQRFLAIHVLQFLASVSRLPDLYRNFTQTDYKKIFGVCQSYLQSTANIPNTPMAEKSSSTNLEDALPQYVYALAHHIITFWYIAMKPQDRAGLKTYITNCLTYKSDSGKDVVEDQGLVTIDMMDRVDANAQRNKSFFSSGNDEEETHVDFTEVDGRLVERHRLAGLLLISTTTALRTSKTIITTRRASGTTRQLIQTINGDRQEAGVTAAADEDNYLTIVPDDIMGLTYGKILLPSPTSPLGSSNLITLPENDAVNRAIAAFDRTSALDSHKAGVIYIGENQTDEATIFQNISGSPDYREFLSGLGEVQRLKHATFNTQGLDRENDTDGPHAIVWNNSVTEVVFHTSTLMPNSTDVLENTGRKKRHIGNDYVNIIFNNSGARLTYETLSSTFPSAFSYVYIVVTPSARTSFIESRTTSTHLNKNERFYKVQILAKPDYPNVSPAVDEKVVSGASLPGLVRNLALNDCMVSLMQSERSDPGEYPSSWRNRMDQLRRMAGRYGDAVEGS